jgi:hypothetical protein
VLPFLAAVDGYLREDGNVPGLRMTVHRVMSREGKEYLQQACAYLRADGSDWRGKVGRTFAVDTGIIGAAYNNGRVWRTTRFDDVATLHAALKKDSVDPETVAKSWLAVPFLGPQNQVVLILFAECDELNFFAENSRVKRVVAMCNGFCRLLAWLQRDPFEHLRNFPLQKGDPVKGVGGVYSFQEAIAGIEPPHFSEVPSFNYEATAA